MHSIRRERDKEYEEILASAQVKKIKVAHPLAHGEVVDLDREPLPEGGEDLGNEPPRECIEDQELSNGNGNH